MTAALKSLKGKNRGLHPGKREVLTMQSKKISTKTIVMTGMMTAVLAVLSQIQIPMPSGVPVTMQTFGVALCACVLGWKMGTASVAVYLLLGAIGRTGICRTFRWSGNDHRSYRRFPDRLSSDGITHRSFYTIQK